MLKKANVTDKNAENTIKADEIQRQKTALSLRSKI